MEIGYPPEVEAFREEVRGWLRANLPEGWFEPGFRLAPEERRAHRDRWKRALHEGRWVGASWPVEYGGRGLSALEQVVMAEEFARSRAPMRVSSLGEILVGPTLLEWGTPEQCREFLPRILAGDIVWCQGFSEPDAGSDLAALATSAVPEGEDLVVTGEKVWASEAEDADYMILLARTDPEASRHAGISFLLLPMRQRGVEVTGIAQPDGTRGFNRVRLAGARCPRRFVVGGEGNGWKVAMTTLGFERGTSAASSYERLRAELDEAIASASASGRARDPLVRQDLARAWSRVEILRMSSYRILTAVHREHHTPATAALEALNKLYWSEYDQWAQNLALGLLGSAGQLLTGRPEDERRPAVGLGRREPVHHYPASPLQGSFLFSLAETIYGGTSEIQRNIVAERVLGLPR